MFFCCFCVYNLQFSYLSEFNRTVIFVCCVRLYAFMAWYWYHSCVLKKVRKWFAATQCKMNSAIFRILIYFYLNIYNLTFKKNKSNWANLTLKFQFTELLIMSSKLTKTQHADMTKLFYSYDKNGDGTISVKELQLAMESLGFELSTVWFKIFQQFLFYCCVFFLLIQFCVPFFFETVT